MCAIDRAVATAPSTGLGGIEGACAPIQAERWRDECWFRAAEAVTAADRVPDAFRACDRATSFARMCVGHVAWLRSESLVGAGPADAGAQAAVDAFVATVPDPPNGKGVEAARWSPREVARGAAWHGVYAGSGLADPAAARAARPEDAPFARGAFVWEAARLLGAGESPAALVAAVQAVWRGEAPPPTGKPLPQACWSGRLVPRKALGYGSLRTLRTWSGGERFVADDPETDVEVAVLEARWAAGFDPSPAALQSQIESPAVEVRRTAARHIGAAGGTPGPGARPEDGLGPIAAAVRTAAAHGSGGRPVVAKGAECGE